MPTELSEQRLRRRLAPAETAADDAEPERESGPAPDSALTRWLPDTTSEGPSGWLAAARADPGRAGVVALAVVGVVAVLVTVFTLIRDKPPPVTAANLPPVQMVSSASATPTAAAAGPVVVSVVGLVHKPGLVTLDGGARIADALTAAGGPLDGADLIGLNMARRVTDGEQIVVGIAAPPGKPATMGSSVTGGSATSTAPAAPAGAPGAAGPVDLNTATVEQLDTLPGVGPVTAAAIVAWRDTHGRFGSVDQLGEVDGIGPARLEKLRPLVRV
jgi:competence protein ComEA